MADEFIAATRVCTKCGVEKPATTEFFGKSKLGKFGLKSRCRPCKVEVERDYNRDYLRRYYEVHHLEMNAYARKRHAERDVEATKVKQREYYAGNRQAVLSRAKAWRAANPERARGIVKKYEAANPHVRRLVKSNRRAREIEAGGKATLVEINKLAKMQKGLCWWCQDKSAKWHLDHRIPLAKGGTSDIANLVLSCPPCNMKKSDKMPWEMDNNPRLL